MNRRWKHKISITGFQESDPNDFAKLARVTYDALEDIQDAYPDDIQLDEIRDYFHTIGFVESGGALEDFDDALNYLYNWGDLGKRLWVDTP